MVLTAAQIGLCFQTYWYMWLINGLSGLLFVGIEIGIAAFFINKFLNKKPPLPHQHLRPSSSVSSTRPILSPSEITSLTDTHVHGPTERHSAISHGAFSASARSALGFNTTEDNDTFAQITLQTINGARARYNSQPLEIDDQLSEIAQRWAEQMARTGKLEHSPFEWRTYQRHILGENYAASFQVELTGEKMVKKWLKEGKRYMFGYDGRKDSENFTQLVWQASQEIGVGRARSEDGSWWYGVVVFNPPGNIPNQYAMNVPLPAH